MELAYQTILASLNKKWILGLLCVLILFASAAIGGFVPLLLPLLGGLAPMLALAMIGLWPFMWVVTKRFDWLVFAMFCLFGFVQIEPAPTDLLLIALLSLGLVLGHLSLNHVRQDSVVNFLIWVFLIANVVSLIVAPDFLGSTRYVFITLLLMFLFYFLQLYITSRRRMQAVVFGYIVSGLLSIGLITMGYLEIGPGDLFIEQTRARAFFKDANVFGPFLVPVIVILVAEIWQPNLIQGKNLLKIGIVGLLTMGVFLSFSRAAWANLLLSLGIYFLLRLRDLDRQRLMLMLKLGILGIVALIVLINVLDLQDFLAYRASAVQSYDSERFDAQLFGLRTGFSHLGGLGPGALDNAFFAPHSLYIRTFGEHGILGFLSLIGVMVVLMWRVLKVSLSQRPYLYGLSATAVFAIGCGLVFNSFVIDTIHWRHYWWVLGMLWVVSRASLDSYAPPQTNLIGGAYG